MGKKPIILGSNVIAESRLFTIESVHLKFTNAEERHFERIVGWANGSVMVVPVLNDEEFILIREYATGIDQYVLTFPKGVIENDEKIAESGLRELREEAGYNAKKITPLTEMATSPGYMTTKMQVMLAEELYHDPAPGDEPEPLEVINWRFDQIPELLNHPEFCEGRSMAALLLAERRLRGVD